MDLTFTIHFGNELAIIIAAGYAVVAFFMNLENIIKALKGKG